MVDVRLDSKNIAHAPCLVSVLLVGLAKRIDVVDTKNPLVLLELNLSAEIMHMADEGTKNLTVSRLSLWAHEVDDMLCEVGVKLGFLMDAIGAVGAVGTAGSVGSHYVEKVCCVEWGQEKNEKQLRLCDYASL